MLSISFYPLITFAGRTLEQMEKMRTEYRGALMWMKNISRDFNPDQYNQLEKFRQVQEIVRQKKAKFDALKIKSIQKIDLLAASRCNMFSHALILYQNAIILFSEKTAKTLNTVASNFQGYQHYDFQVIKELAEPESRRTDDTNDAAPRDEETFFNAEYHDDNDKHESACDSSKASQSKERSDSLLNFYDASSDSNNKHTPSNVDYLSEANETDTQQMLNELFYNSPVRTPLAAEGGRSDGSGERNFLPSHLLDSGVLDWGQNITGGQVMAGGQTSDTDGQTNSSCGHRSTALSNRAANTSDDSSSRQSAPANSSSQSSHQADQAQSAGRDKLSKKDSAKLDWFKVFQDIDPLSDPSNDYFSKKDEGDAC